MPGEASLSRFAVALKFRFLADTSMSRTAGPDPMPPIGFLEAVIQHYVERRQEAQSAIIAKLARIGPPM